MLAQDTSIGKFRDRVYNADVRQYTSERQLLEAWFAYVRQQDVDALALFQVTHMIHAYIQVPESPRPCVALRCWQSESLLSL